MIPEGIKESEERQVSVVVHTPVLCLNRERAIRRDLKARLKQLEEKFARQDRQIRGVAKKPAVPPEPEPPIVCKDQPCPEPPSPVFVSFTNGLKVES
jgi:hypothetical protein